MSLPSLLLFAALLPADASSPPDGPPPVAAASEDAGGLQGDRWLFGGYVERTTISTGNGKSYSAWFSHPDRRTVVMVWFDGRQTHRSVFRRFGPP
jgi:hypothetical protein